MITERMKRFIEEIDRALVASTDAEGRPHLAAGGGVRVADPQHVVFEAWLCRKTLENVAHNPQVAVAVVDPASGAGYQLTGAVESTADIGILNGYAPGLEAPGTPQVESRMVVRVRNITEFSNGSHTDTLLTPEG